MSNHIDVRDLIDRSPMGAVQYWIIATCILIAILDGYDTAVVGVAGPALISQGLVDAKSFSYVVSTGIVGFVPGMLLFGPAADRWGRKPVLGTAVVIFATGSLLTAVSGDLPMLFVARLVTGVGVGGASPCLVSLAAEYAPQRLRTVVVTTLWAGVPGGGILGGLVAAHFLQAVGWQGLFYFGAVAPALSLLLLFFTVPESVGFLALRGGRDKQIRSILRRVIGRDVAPDSVAFVVPQNEKVRSSVKSLFAQDQARVTLALWLAFFCSFGTLVMISQYTAVLLHMTGMLSAQVGTVFSFFYIGSVIGTVMAGPTMNRMAHTTATAWGLMSLAISSVLFGFLTGDFLSAVIGITIVGVTAGFGAGALVALAAEFYPLSFRAPGVGWGLALSRVGATLGPLLSGLLVAWGLTNTAYYLVVGFIGAVAASAIFSLPSKQRRSVGPLAGASSHCCADTPSPIGTAATNGIDKR